jgi:hypothetical protein
MEMMIRRTILQVEELSQRILPSVSPLAQGLLSEMMTVGPIHTPTAPSHHALSGSGSGTYTATPLLAERDPPPALPGHAQPQFIIIVGDIGENYVFDGTANLARLGDVTVSGSILGLGNVATGHASGVLTFANAHGSVTITVTGPSQPGFSPLPTHFAYTVTSGTGAYQHVNDHGTLSLALTPNTNSTLPASQGTFALTIT